MKLRPIEPRDHADVLALNERNVELLAPLSEERLVELAGAASFAHVIDVDGAFAGFVLVFTAGAAYDGENFAWFAERYPDYGYLDRIVLHEDFRRRGLGGQVYDEVEAATSGIEGVEFYRYDAGHAFSNWDTHFHDAAAADAAWPRTLAFLAKWLR